MLKSDFNIKHINTYNKRFSMKKLFSLIPLIILFSSIICMPIYAKDDYSATAGVIWATNFNSNDLVHLIAGHNYYFVFETTESLKISGFVFNLWNVSDLVPNYDYIFQETVTPFDDFGVFHIDVTFYEASASQAITTSNPLVPFYKDEFAILNETDTTQYIYTETDGQTFVPTHANVWIALAISPSIDIFINSTTSTAFTQYEKIVTSDLIVSNTVSYGERLGVIGYWSLNKGAVSEDIVHPVPISFREPSTFITIFSNLYGLSYDALSIGVYTATVFGLVVLCIQKGIDLSGVMVGVLCIAVSVLFTILNIMPTWFFVANILLSVSLIGYDYKSNQGGGI